MQLLYLPTRVPMYSVDLIGISYSMPVIQKLELLFILAGCLHIRRLGGQASKNNIRDNILFLYHIRSYTFINPRGKFVTYFCYEDLLIYICISVSRNVTAGSVSVAKRSR